MFTHQQVTNSFNNTLFNETCNSNEQLDSKSRKRVKRYTRTKKACIYCARSHMSCEESRPCKRCISRGIADLCKDLATGKKRGRKVNYRDEECNLSSSDEVLKLKQESTLSSKSASGTENLLIQNQIIVNTAPNNFEIFGRDVDFPENFQVELSDFFLCSSWNEPSQIVEEFDFQQMNVSFQLARQKLSKICPPNEIDFLINQFIAVRQQLKNYVSTKFGESFPEKWWCLESKKPEINAFVEIQKQAFDCNGVPTIVWERTGGVIYINQAYQMITNYNLPVPSSRDINMFWNELSPRGYKDFLISSMKFYAQDFSSKSNAFWFSFNTGIKVHGEDKYVEGIFTVSIKTDDIGLPFLFVGNFVPR